MKRRGFTLVELMIIVMILAILFSILLSSFGRAKRRHGHGRVIHVESSMPYTPISPNS